MRCIFLKFLCYNNGAEKSASVIEILPPPFLPPAGSGL
nr:MAG TPA: hypothetical protein [Caudoviricetes sp.]